MKKFISSTALFLLPLAVFAQQSTTQTTGLDSLLGKITNFMGKLFPIAVGIAVLAFFYEIIMFIYNKDNPDKKASFQKGILMSLVAIFVMLAFFGIIRVIANTIGIQDTLGAGIDTGSIPSVDLTPKGQYNY